MDWGNAIVRSKKVDASGQVTSMEMDLKLDGDFRKTKKKVTWLAQPTPSSPLVDVTLLDYDYLITKKKLEKDDKIEDFATPVSEFREEALADANVKDLKKGDVLQFERKGYFVFDGEVDSRLEFIRIPEGNAASLASKAGSGSATPSSKHADSTTKSTIPVSTKMYNVAKVYGDDVKPSVDTKMYVVQNVYDQIS
jgi:glutamyl-tRNA synthetase